MVIDPLWKHDTVLLPEAVSALNIQSAGVYVDGTYGRGGHSALILEYLGVNGRLIVIDKDPVAIEHARQRYADDPRVHVWHGSFRDFPEALIDAGINEKIQGILLDLGVSSPQLDDAERGFSFMREGLLDMRMDTSRGESAAQWLNQADEAAIVDVLWRYGEERFSRQIAKEIVRVRTQNPLQTTTQLADLIASVIRKREPGKNPATRSFQAIRIKVNQELDDVEACLQQTLEYLAPEGRLVVISFHSLEDRIVKHFFRDVSSPPRLPKGLPMMPTFFQPPMQLVGKAQRASDAEVSGNVRSRSAIMRVGERTA
ncbi:16S rRNA (cytosine(1402)-N(4))-methyltransferase RsmH [Thiothrix lacustris]|uniref:Ribosomal RNA small subunit methyltransferase H n=1 Tax=Thiothrix lacustris TaxID=525917 RepID=A0ABY9MVD5_9GAMM|nr:16S rRNA (cytosine(1402)-N(4))-methyltransferase RsmH [Thiothrix lacustris]WML92467.1 16S rRNA (cytosine(1402)-N(4))-methyltransferase RsmH [Thiothrix lacustris]